MDRVVCERNAATFERLICPQCGGPLRPAAAAADRLNCAGCPLNYPVRDGVPVIVIGQASVRHIETDAEFEHLVAEALAVPFSGWDLSWLDGRRVSPVDPRGSLHDRYEARARELVRAASAVLDLGTGGGERLSRLGPFPPHAVATEAYAPNVPLAAARLAPFGVQVIWTDGACQDSRGPQPGNQWPQRRLPFADDTFDLVLASSTSFCPREVFRVLGFGGTLLTVQGGTEQRGPSLAEALEGTPPLWATPGQTWDVDATVAQAGFEIVQRVERATPTTYRDIDAVVFVLKHAPWAIVDFDVERYRARLYQLHRRIKAEGGLTIDGYGFVVEARKP